MTDPGADRAPRPRPQYGEYAPPGWVSPNADAVTPAPVPSPVAAAPAPPRSWDRPLTYALFGLGFIGMSFGVFGGTNLALVLQQAGSLQGITLDLPSWTAAAGIAIAVSHVVLYAIALIGGVAMLRRGRPAFWIPLGAGVVAALIYHGLTGAIGIAAGLLPA